MEQLLLLLQQIYRDLSILSNYPPEEREERLEGYFQFLVETREIIRVLNRIVGEVLVGDGKLIGGVCPGN